MICSHFDFGKCLNNTISMDPSELIKIATNEHDVDLHRIASLYNLSRRKISIYLFSDLLIRLDANGSIAMRVAVSYLGRYVRDRKLDKMYIRHFYSNDGSMMVNALSRFYQMDKFLYKYFARLCKRRNVYYSTILSEVNNLLQVTSFKISKRVRPISPTTL